MTESGIIWELGFWVCLWGMVLIMLTQARRPIFHLKNDLLYYLFVWMWSEDGVYVPRCTCMEVSLWELVLCFCHVGPSDGTQAIGLGSPQLSWWLRKAIFTVEGAIP